MGFLFSGAFGGTQGQGLRRAGHPSQAKFPARACVAPGPPSRRAKGSAQLHKGLGEVPALPQRIYGFQGRRHRPLHGRRVHGLLDMAKPGDHPQHIAIHRRYRHTKTNGADGPRRIIPDARKAADGFVFPGKYPVVFPLDLLRGPL